MCNVVPLEEISVIGVAWRVSIAEYDAFYAARINQILAEDGIVYNELTKMQDNLDRILDRLARAHVGSAEDVIHILEIALESGAIDEEAPAGRAVKNAINFLKKSAEQMAIEQKSPSPVNFSLDRPTRMD